MAARFFAAGFAALDFSAFFAAGFLAAGGFAVVAFLAAGPDFLGVAIPSSFAHDGTRGAVQRGAMSPQTPAAMTMASVRKPKSSPIKTP